MKRAWPLTLNGEPQMTLTHDDVRKILAILDASDYEDLRLELGDLKLELRRHGDTSEHQRTQPSSSADAAPLSSPFAKTAGTETATPTAPASSRTSRDAALSEGVAAVIAPMLGTCYRAPTPGAKPFVEIGDKVGPEDTVCLVEVMKLFNSLKAGVAGTVEQILFENATLVEYGKILMLIRKETA